MTKRCLKCDEEKDISEFSLKRISLKGNKHYQSYCRDCQRKYTAAHYRDNKDSYAERMKKVVVGRKKWLNDYKKSLACKVCGENTPACLDFHHLDPNSKESGISDMLRSNSIDSIKAEIDKCVVLCANCHRKFHANLLVIPE